ncbi:uncharacterized transporter, putative [Babesia ovata]|uniref:Uncharacterized transporter, putative n=1 Tax=Babesia ovata TaxID=189622 RepID=A0A2H6KKJ4_9APIC|nr:uncharacterized transporter, putative [Babesia ovata]GBE63513.1 uncharacterized transporter, putative [Babesia ovata]
MIVVCVQGERSKFYGNLPGHDQQLDYSALDGGDEILCVRRGGTVLHCASNLLDYRIYKRINRIWKLINFVRLKSALEFLNKCVATLLKSGNVAFNFFVGVGIDSIELAFHHITGRSSFARKLLLNNYRDLVVEVRVDCIVILFHSIVPMKLLLTVVPDILLNKGFDRVHLQNIILNPSLYFMLKL